MKIFKSKDLPEGSGDMILLYGEAGVGKSVTSLQTAELPILYIMTEPRDVKKFLIASGREADADRIDFAFYEGWSELIDFINTVKHFEPYRTVIIDSLSHLIAINLSSEIENEAFDSLDKKKDIDKPLVMQTKMSQEGYGALSAQMLRFTNAASRLSQLGKVVICLARMENNPKYNRALSAAPALKGQEYPKHMQGFFDFIGLVERRVDENDEVVYPPVASFASADDSFIAKWNGKLPKGGVQKKVLNITKLLQASRGLLG